MLWRVRVSISLCTASARTRLALHLYIALPGEAKIVEIWVLVTTLPDSSNVGYITPLQGYPESGNLGWLQAAGPAFNAVVAVAAATGYRPGDARTPPGDRNLSGFAQIPATASQAYSHCPPTTVRYHRDSTAVRCQAGRCRLSAFAKFCAVCARDYRACRRLHWAAWCLL